MIHRFIQVRRLDDEVDAGALVDERNHLVVLSMSDDSTAAMNAAG